MVFSNTYNFVTKWFLILVYVVVDVLDFVIVLYQSGVFEYILFCVLMVVATRVCYGSRSRLRDRVVSESCFRIHIDLQGLRGGLLCISAKRTYVRRENCFGGLKTKWRGTFGNFNVPPRGFCQVWSNTYLYLKINMQ